METKEAIEFMTLGLQYTESINEKNTLNDIIELLKRGEKFEAMWGELEKRHKSKTMVDHFDKISYSGEDDTFYELKEIKQKYFPKEDRK